ncbi:MAG: VIT domain-containing protein, partial [Rhodovibrionaceae bacterium]
MRNRPARRESRQDTFSISDAARLAAMGRRAIAVVLASLLVALAGISLFALVAPELVAPAKAQTRQQTPEIVSGLFFRSEVAGKVFEAPLVGSEVDITVNGEIARVSVVQHFHNPSDAWMEGAYVFPLPEDSAVDRLTMTIGARQIDGVIMEREEARRVYEEAAAEGKRASLLSSERANVFTTSVANVGPGETVSVKIEYQESLSYKDGRYSLRFPMVVAPRYSPGEAVTVKAPAPGDGAPRPQPISEGATGQPEPKARDLFGPVRGADEGTANPVKLRVEIDAGRPLAKLESLYHDVTVEQESSGRTRVVLSDGDVPADRDFVLEWQPEVEAAPEAALFAEQVGDNSYLRLSLLPQGDSGEVARPQRDLIFIVDTSGSMYGPSMDQARDALLTALGRLQPGDRFEIIRFSDRTQTLFGGVRPF